LTGAAAIGRMLAVARVGISYRWRHGRWPSLAAPKRFTEWVQWRKLHDRDPERSRLTDKSYSKRLATRVLGKAFVVPTLWRGQSLPPYPAWPMPFIVKSNHGCGQWVAVRDLEDYARARQLAPSWLRRGYGRWLDEHHYRGAARYLLVEPLVGPVDGLPLDYKVYVFNGRAAMVQVHEGRGGEHRWSQYDRGFSLLSNYRGSATRPSTLPIMLDAAERLGAGHDFIRVDFYEVEGQPQFGEFCLYPGSGLDPFDPVGLDDWLGLEWSRSVDLGGKRLSRPAQLVVEPASTAAA
jgi:hypothetical protein